jgi:hypothetical protein
MQTVTKLPLSRIPATVATPTIAASLVVLPFVILEAINRRGFGEGFPLALFVAMWLLPAAFTVVLMPILRRLRAGGRAAAHPTALVPRLLLLIVIAWLWLGLVIDQLPCFLGVPNCD